MLARRVVLVVLTIALAALLSACQCQVGNPPPGGKEGGPGVPFGTAEDPAEVTLKPLNGKVKREGDAPDGAVVEVTLFKDNVTDADLKELAQFNKLRKVVINRGKLTGTGFKAIAGLPLEELHLSFTGINDDGLKEIAKIKTLKVLDLTNADKFTDDGVAVLSSLSNLEELRVGQNRNVMDVGLGKALAGMPNLRKLDFGNSQVGDGALQKASVSNPEMRVLILHGSNVTDAGMKYVGKMKHLEELRSNTGWNTTDKGLVELAGLTKLRSLDVNNTHITFDGLMKSPVLPRLKKLHIGGPLSQIAPAQVEQLRQAAPECNIVRD